MGSGLALLLERSSVVREAYLEKDATDVQTAADAAIKRREMAARGA